MVGGRREKGAGLGRRLLTRGRKGRVINAWVRARGGRGAFEVCQAPPTDVELEQRAINGLLDPFPFDLFHLSSAALFSTLL